MVSAKEILSGDRRSLAKAITLIESKKDEHRTMANNLLEELLPHTGKSYRIGISGTPGVGKSTFIETFGEFLINKGHKVAVLAVDPSSPKTGGSILGDKTRMDKLSQNDLAFVRPSPSGGNLGGVTLKTRESILACEAAGFDMILVETVGVGQSEFQVSEMVDFFMVLLLPNAGDELQGIKKGILEIAHSIVINKADGPTKELAELAKSQYQSAIELFHQSDSWKAKVLTVSSLEKKGMEDIFSMLEKYKLNESANGNWDKVRKNQLKLWFQSSLENELKRAIMSNSKYEKKYQSYLNDIEEMKKIPGSAASDIVNSLLKD